MKRFLIEYTFSVDPSQADAWHREVAAFIANIDADPELRGKLRYRCMKAKTGSRYVHIAEPADDETVQALNRREWFQRYTAETKRVAGDTLTVSGLETLAETQG
jgi:hypothetical protein